MRPPAPPNAFTMVEILVVVAVVVILAGLAFPAVTSLLKGGHQARCVGNLKQISAASAAYAGDHAGDFPPNAKGTGFAKDLEPYLGPYPRRPGAGFRQSPLVCPAQANGLPDGRNSYRGIYTINNHGLSYAQNLYVTTPRVKRRASIRHPSRLMLYMDFENQYQAQASEMRKFRRWETLADRHGGKVNVAFADGSVAVVRMEEIPLEGGPSLFWEDRE